jgi:hypothetical protein
VSGPGVPRPLASEADRERLVVLLREHYAVGLFGLDELDRRVGVVLSAQYLDEAAGAIADLPGIAGTGAAGTGAAGAGTVGTGTAEPRGAGPPRRTRRRRGHAHADQPAAGWIPTNERFRDPSTSTIMRVWVDPADQSRHYVPEPEA